MEVLAALLLIFLAIAKIIGIAVLEVIFGFIVIIAIGSITTAYFKEKK